MAVTPGGPGLLTNLSPINFSVFSAADVPDGVYNLGYACTIGIAGPSQLDKYWNIKISFSADVSDLNGFIWALAAPGVPTSLAQSSSTATTTTVDFSYAAPATAGASAVTDYLYRYGTAATGPWTTVDTASAAAGTQQITGLTARTKYYIQVQAQNASDVGPWATVNATTLAAAPGTPSGAAGDTKVTLTWTPSATDGAATVTYKVEKTTNDGGNWTQVSAAATSPFDVTSLANGTAYKFRVSSTTAGGLNPSGMSAAVTPVAAPVVPGVPTGLGVAASATTTADLSWTAPVDNGGDAIVDYAVRYSATGGAPWTTVSHSASTATTIQVTGLTSGTPYTFGVAAQNTAVGVGTYATVSGATVSGAPGTPAIGALGNGSVAVSWSAPTGTATFTYNLDKTSNNGVTWTSVATGIATTTKSVTGLVNGTAYKFRVSATDTGGTSVASATSAAGTPRKAPTAPGKPAVAPAKASVKLTWALPKSNGGAAITGYVVQKSLDGIHWTTVTLAAPLTRVYTVTGLTSGRVWRFRVAAKNVAGIGAYSLVTVATPR
ncbi:MAG: fibronectin type III domain-containing protein [Actinomycetota bacterium]